MLQPSADIQKSEDFQMLDVIQYVANGGSAAAQYDLGLLYDPESDWKINELTPDEQSAVYWMEQAGNQRFPEALRWLSDYYGVRNCAEQAADWMEQVQAQDDVSALFFLGYYYLENACKNQLDKAISYAKRAAALGSVFAKYLCVRAYCRMGNPVAAEALLPEISSKIGLTAHQIVLAALQADDNIVDLVERRLCNLDVVFQPTD